MEDKKRIVFRCNAGPEVGLGHLIRSLALANYLNEKFTIIFVLNEIPNYDLTILKNSGFTYIFLKSIQQLNPDHYENSEIIFDLNGVIKTSDIVVLDGYRFGSNYRKQCKKQCFKVICIEDYVNGIYPVDLVISPSPSKLVFPEANESFSGIENSLIRPEISNNKFQYIRDPNSVLISFGGSDSFNLSPIYAKAVLSQTNYKLTIIMTELFCQTNLNQINKIKNKFNKRVTINSNVNAFEINKLMRESNKIICTASVTIVEAAICGITPIFGWLSENQMSYYDFFESKYPKNGIGCLKLFNESSFLNALQNETDTIKLGIKTNDYWQTKFMEL